MNVYTKCDICERNNQPIVGTQYFNNKKFYICNDCFEKCMAVLSLIQKAGFFDFKPRTFSVQYIEKGLTDGNQE